MPPRVFLRLRLTPGLRGGDRGVVAWRSADAVVGATGQLGTAVIDRLDGVGPSGAGARSRRARRRVRDGPGVEIAFGDLRDAGEPRSRRAEGMALPSSPPPTRCPARARRLSRGRGRRLRESARRLPSGRRPLSSSCRWRDASRQERHDVPPEAADRGADRRQRARATRSSAASLFMDDWFALMGSSIPLRGSKAHTLAATVLVLRDSSPSPGRSSRSEASRSFPATERRGTPTSRSTTWRRFPGRRGRVAGGRRESDRGPRRAGGPVLRARSSRSSRGFSAGRSGSPHARQVSTASSPILLEPLSPRPRNLMAMSWARPSPGLDYDAREARRALRRSTDQRRGVPARQGRPSPEA